MNPTANAIVDPQSKPLIETHINKFVRPFLAY